MENNNNTSIDVPKDILKLIAAYVRESYINDLDDFLHCKHIAGEFILNFRIRKTNAANVNISFVLRCEEPYRADVRLNKQKIFLTSKGSAGYLSNLYYSYGIKFVYKTAASVVYLRILEYKLREILNASILRTEKAAECPAICRKSVLLLCKLIKNIEKAAGNKRHVFIGLEDNFLHTRFVDHAIDIYIFVKLSTEIHHKSKKKELYICKNDKEKRRISSKCMVGTNEHGGQIYLYLKGRDFKKCLSDIPN